MTHDEDVFVDELQSLIKFVDDQAMAESYKPFARKFLAISKLLEQVKVMVKNGQVGAEIVQ